MPESPDAGGLAAEATLAGQPHAVAAGDWGFAAGFALGTSPPTELDVALFDPLGRPLETSVVSTSSMLYPSGTGVALAALPCGRYAAAWTDYGGDGDGAGVALRLVDPGVAIAGPPGHANAGTAFDQVLEDLIWTGSELVVTWSDDSDLSGMGALKVRSFDATLSPTSPDQVLASTAGLSTSAVLAPFAGSWAAAWLSFDAAAVSVLVRAGGSTWSVGPFHADTIVDRPALVDLDGTHLLLVFAAAASMADPVQLQGAILDASAPGNVVPFAIPPVAAAAGSDAREPTLARVGARVFLSWVSNLVPSGSQVLPGDVWLKEMDPGMTAGTIDTSETEIPLPRSAADCTSEQDSPVLALVPEGGPPILVAAWRDQSAASSRILVEALPIPILREVAP